MNERMKFDYDVIAEKIVEIKNIVSDMLNISSNFAKDAVDLAEAYVGMDSEKKQLDIKELATKMNDNGNLLETIKEKLNLTSDTYSTKDQERANS